MRTGRTPESEPPYLYECVACGYRIERDQRPGACPVCGEEMRNLTTPSE